MIVNFDNCPWIKHYLKDIKDNKYAVFEHLLTLAPLKKKSKIKKKFLLEWFSDSDKTIVFFYYLTFDKIKLNYNELISFICSIICLQVCIDFRNDKYKVRIFTIFFPPIIIVFLPNCQEYHLYHHTFSNSSLLWYSKRKSCQYFFSVLKRKLLVQLCNFFKAIFLILFTDCEFECANGSCIDLSSVCDLKIDCFDKTDESSEICARGFSKIFFLIYFKKLFIGNHFSGSNYLSWPRLHFSGFFFADPPTANNNGKHYNIRNFTYWNIVYGNTSQGGFSPKVSLILYLFRA